MNEGNEGFRAVCGRGGGSGGVSKALTLVPLAI